MSVVNINAECFAKQYDKVSIQFTLESPSHVLTYSHTYIMESNVLIVIVISLSHSLLIFRVLNA